MKASLETFNSFIKTKLSKEAVWALIATAIVVGVILLIAAGMGVRYKMKKGAEKRVREERMDEALVKGDTLQTVEAPAAAEEEEAAEEEAATAEGEGG